MDEIKVKANGCDGWGREVYINIKNKRIYKMVDGRLHTSTKEGEPDCPLKIDLDIILVTSKGTEFLQKGIPFKRYKDCNKPFTEYLQVGDIVDDEIAQYFIEVLPPVTMQFDLIQMGEPYSHVECKATYLTLGRTSLGWQYKGICHKGQIINKE